MKYTTLPIGRSSTPRSSPCRYTRRPRRSRQSNGARRVAFRTISTASDHAGWRTSATCGWSRERRARLRHAPRERAVALDHGVGREDVERRERRRAGERVAGVAVRMQERAQRVYSS